MSRLHTPAAQGLAELAARIAEGQRLARGRRYQRDGQVDDLEVGPGWVSATVAGSRAEPYSVSIAAKQANENERQAARSNLAGAVPRTLDVAFTCICPDWGDPCKHGVAVLLAFAREVDGDPSLLLDWRGMHDVDLPAPAGTESLDVHKPTVGASPPRRSGVTPPRPGPVEPVVSEPTLLDDFFRGAMPSELTDVVGPLDEVQLDAYGQVSVPLEKVDAGPVIADAIETIAEYWLER